MREDRRCGFPRVPGDDEVPARQEGERLGGDFDPDGPPGGCPETDQRVLPRGFHDPMDIRNDRIPDGNPFDQRTDLPDLFRCDDGEETVPRTREGIFPDKTQFRFPVGVGKPEPEDEPVQLRLWEGIGSVQLERILGGDNEKRIREGVVFASTDTWRSLIASSRALWARGLLRLISSASTMFAERGPGEEVKLLLSASKMWTRTTS